MPCTTNAELSPASAGFFVRVGESARPRRMPDLATIGSRLPFMWLQPRGPALTTNLTKALFFEKNARKTQNKARRDRLLRAARRYLLAAAKDLEPLPKSPPRIK